MANTIVIDTTAQETQQGDFSVLGFSSVLPDSTIVGANEDQAYPFVNVLDYRDNTKYSPSINSGSVSIEFRQPSNVVIDYFAFAVHNSQDSGLSGKLEVDSGTGFEVVAEFASIKNNRPFMKYFGKVSSARQRLTLNFTSKLFIGSISLGQAVVFERTPSLGLQVGRFSSLDEVEQFTTEGNNFIIGRRISKGFQTRANFRYVNFSSLEDWWEDYQNHVLDSKTLYFKWSNTKDQTTYGLQNVRTITKPTYVTSFHSDINIEINGYA